MLFVIENILKSDRDNSTSGAPPEKLENKFTVVLFFSVSNFQLKKGGSAINQPMC